MSRIDLKGDIKSRAQGEKAAPKYTAGPVPIDLPNINIYDSLSF